MARLGPRRPLLLVLFLAIVCAIIYAGRDVEVHDVAKLQDVQGFVRPPTDSYQKTIPDSEPCAEHLGWLGPYQFQYPIKYVSRDIITHPTPNAGRPSLTILDEPLFEDFTAVDLLKSTTANVEHCLPPLVLEVPRGRLHPADASSIIFGLQTTIGRLRDTVKHLARWLPRTGARLYAIVVDIDGENDNAEIPAKEQDIAKLQKEFHDLDMNVMVIHPVRPTDDFPQRYFSLVNVMYANRDEKTKWIATIDDDTFFPSMHDLLDMLEKHDHKRPQYIGSLSEDWWAVNHYGLMGFGGAGIMLSVPMAKIIDDHTREYIDHLRTSAGDVSVMDAVYRWSTVKLTHIASLHQVDMHGDLSGFYESGREMLSLHHWKEGSAAGYKLEMEKMHLVADICDSCFLQRWQFSHDILLSNGFSITHYPMGHLSGQQTGVLGKMRQVGKAMGGQTVGDVLGGEKVEKLKMYEMERTWEDDINVKHSLDPSRDRLEENQKESFVLLDSVIVERDVEGHGYKDVVRQIYFKEGVDKDGARQMDTVMVLNWKAGTHEPLGQR